MSSIAARLGVSCSTVSRVLNGNATQHRIPRETAERILEEAKRCHYDRGPKQSKQSRSATIGLVIPSLSNPFFADMASVVISEAKALGYTTLVIDTMEDENLEKASLMTMLDRQVEGIIVAPCGGNKEVLEDIDFNGVPVVLIDRYFDDTDLAYVTTNNYKGGHLATRTLLDYGHTKIACIQGVETSRPNQMRVRGYLDAMNEAGLSGKTEVVGREFSTQNGYVEMKMLLSKKDRPTAIFALSNTILLGALKAIHETDLRIPDDISLISFDNNIFLDYMVPPIARVSQPIDDMGRIATKILFEKLNIADKDDKKSMNSSHIMLVPNLVTGASIRPNAK